MSIKNNTASLQNLLDAVNSLPEASGGMELPTLTNEGSASDLLSGKQLIDGDGNVVTGTIATKTSSNLTASGATVTVPAGYYASQATKSVATATQATPSITVNSSGLITATATQTAGYVSAGTKSATKQLTTKAATTYTPTTTNQTIASGTYLTGVQTIKGDANLIAGNIKSGVSIFGVSGTLTEGSGGGSSGTSDIEDAIITKTISTYTNDRVTSVGGYTFCGCKSLTTVSFLSCEYIGTAAFAHCEKLASVNFPVCTSIGYSAFSSCSMALTSVNFPACTNIYAEAFARCSRLTSVNFPVCSTIGHSAFYNCESLSEVSFPVCSTIGHSAFYNCEKLISVNFPACISIGSNAFYSCSRLTSVNFPVCSTIYSSAFYSCSRLTSVTIGTPKICKLANSNAFLNTPISASTYTGTFGSIYVPASLASRYKEATNWAIYADRIVGDTSLDSAAPTITFTIGSTTCQAEEGMTWEQWCDSEYNTIGGLVITSPDRIHVDIDGKGYYVCDEYSLYWYVSPSEIIYDGSEYTTEAAGFDSPWE